MKNLCLILFCICCICVPLAVGDWDEGQPAKWVQLPDLTPNGVDICVDDSGTWSPPDRWIGDDFECVEAGAITGVHLWGSWRNDDVGQITKIRVAFFSDDPIGAGGSNPGNLWSTPDQLLWEREFDASQIVKRLYYTMPQGNYEWWWDPTWNIQDDTGDTQVWQYNIEIADDPSQEPPNDKPFIQAGSPDQPVIYWLTIEVKTDHSIDYTFFGWKTDDPLDGSFQDNAVWFSGGTWTRLTYPSAHPYYLQSPQHLDMAFVLTSDFQQEDLDYGDAPDPFMATPGEYPTLLANNGARHIIGGPWLGDLSDFPDPEADGQPDSNATGDDNNGFSPDDEDGISFSALVQGQPASVTFEVNGAPVGGPGANVDGWIDFDSDGKWDFTEQIVTGPYVDGVYTVPFTVPASARVGQTFSRFRISTDTSIIGRPIGLAQDGEVEDHEVFIEEAPSYEIKWEQLPNPQLSGLHAHDYSTDPYTQIIIADDWQCEGGVVTDFHWWGTVEDFGAGLAGFHLSIHANDPTGSCLPLDPPLWQKNVPLSDITVTWTGTFYRYDYYLQPEDYFYQIEGQTYWFDVSALSIDPRNACLWIWAEHNRSTMPILCGAADKIIPTRPVWQTITWTAQPPVYSDMAFRVTSDPFIELMDYGDAPDRPYPTLLANNGARHVISGPWLGDASDMPDPEGNGQPDPIAMGDDNDGNDDEDGVSIPVMNQGIATTIGVLVSGGGGFVDAWVDWDGSGSWDAGEQIHNALLPDGWTFIPVTPPTNAVIGQTFARFRISTNGGLPPDGLSPDGEVEDHVVLIEEGPQADLGDAPDSSNSHGVAATMTAYPNGTQANYPTVFAAGSPPFGPKHNNPLSGVWLGPNVTLEDEADIGLDLDTINNIDPPNDVPDQDDADDGLFLPVNMPRCKWTNVDYDVNVSDTTVTYYVNIWCDFNRDGDWDDQVSGCLLGDVPEWAVRNQMLNGLTTGLNTVKSLPFVSWHPIDGPEGLWMRITISEQPWQEIWGAGGCGPVNGYDVGETEDYYVVPDTSCVECADLNCNGFVDLADFAIFASQWLTTCP